MSSVTEWTLGLMTLVPTGACGLAAQIGMGSNMFSLSGDTSRQSISFPNHLSVPCHLARSDSIGWIAFMPISRWQATSNCYRLSEGLSLTNLFFTSFGKPSSYSAIYRAFFEGWRFEWIDSRVGIIHLLPRSASGPTVDPWALFN